MTKIFQKARLLKLADLLEADAKNKKGIKFDLGSWGATENVKAFTEVNCNTTACAIGLACVSGAFKRVGFSFDVDDEGCITPTLVYDDPDWGRDILSDFDAVETLFGLNETESNFLFGADQYPHAQRKGAEGERAVAKRIRAFVKDRSIAGE